MALMQAGIPHKVIATSDINKFSNASYEAIFGDNPNMGDICKIQKLPESDILIYSFPCTDLSIAVSKTRTGMAEGVNHRSSLIWEVGRLLLQCKEDDTLPTWLLMENVPAINDRMNRPEFLKWLEVLDSLGYTTEYGGLNAAEFGMAQKRKRMYVLSRLGGECPKLPVGSGLKQVLGDILEEDVPAKYYLTKARLEGLERSNRKEEANGNGYRSRPVDREGLAHSVTGHPGSRKTDNYIVDSCHRVGTAVGIGRFESSQRVYAPDGLAPTQTHTATKITEDGKRIRKLTPRETWRLQGFPDWAFDRARDIGTSDTQLYCQSGNPIPVPVLEAIFTTVYEWDKEHGVIE